MPSCTIKVINTDPNCVNNVDALDFPSGCNNNIIRISSNSTATGPFDFYINDVLYLSGLTKTQMLEGIITP